MTEQETIEMMQGYQMTDAVDRAEYDAFGMAIDALEEIQQYRATGTVEECREAREKQTPKQPILYGGEDGKLICPNCNEDLWDLKECGFNFCPYCGQAIGFLEGCG